VFTSTELDIIWLTIKVALVSTAVSLPISVLLGWIFARKNITCKPLLEGLVALPLVAPPVVTGYLLLLLLGRNGWIGRWLDQTLDIQLAFNFAALVIASVVVSLPLAVRTIRSAFELVDPVYEKASHTLGASKRSTFFRVTLPMAMPGIVSGMILSFARSLGEFGATITLAGNIIGKTQTLSLMVYANMQVPDKEMEVARLVIISLLISLAAIIASEYLKRRNSYLSK